MKKRFCKDIHFGRVCGLVWCEPNDHPFFSSIHSAKCLFFHSSFSLNHPGAKSSPAWNQFPCDFWNNVGHMACCNTTVLGPQIQNFILICCFFTWRRASEGLRKSLKSLTNTKISPKQFFKTFLKVLPETTCILFFI